jgi:hypothetical protein
MKLQLIGKKINIMIGIHGSSAMKALQKIPGSQKHSNYL